MKTRFSKVLLLSLIAISISACGDPFDGSWVVDKEVSAADCELAINSEKNNDDDGSNMMAGMLEGLTKTMCEGLVLNVAPAISIKKNKMTISSLEKEVECTIDLKTNAFQCDNENSKNNSGSIKIIDSQLVWALPSEPEKMSMKFTYNRDNE